MESYWAKSAKSQNPQDYIIDLSNQILYKQLKKSRFLLGKEMSSLQNLLTLY